MSSRVDLKELIEALAGAVIDAQDRIEQHQIAKLGQYFDEDNRPRTVVMRLPSMQPDAEPGTEDLYRAPLLGLVPANALKIKDVEMRFDVDLGALQPVLQAVVLAEQGEDRVLRLRPELELEEP